MQRRPLKTVALFGIFLQSFVDRASLVSLPFLLHLPQVGLVHAIANAISLASLAAAPLMEKRPSLFALFATLSLAATGPLAFLNAYAFAVAWGISRGLSLVYSSYLGPGDVVARAYAVNIGLVSGSLLAGFGGASVLPLLTPIALLCAALAKAQPYSRQMEAALRWSTLTRLNVSFLLFMAGYFTLYPFMPLYLSQTMPMPLVGIFFAYVDLISLVNLYIAGRLLGRLPAVYVPPAVSLLVLLYLTMHPAVFFAAAYFIDLLTSVYLLNLQKRFLATRPVAAFALNRVFHRAAAVVGSSLGAAVVVHGLALLVVLDAVFVALSAVPLAQRRGRR